MSIKKLIVRFLHWAIKDPVATGTRVSRSGNSVILELVGVPGGKVQLDKDDAMRMACGVFVMYGFTVMMNSKEVYKPAKQHEGATGLRIIDN